MTAQQGKFQQGFRLGIIWLVCLALSLTLVQGCAALRPRNPLPEYLEDKVEVPGMPHVRAWGDEVSEVFTRFTLESVRQERAAYGEDIGRRRPPSWPCLAVATTAPLAPESYAAGARPAPALSLNW